MEPTLLTKLSAIALIVAFIVMVIVNVVVTTGLAVRYTNSEIANTHPVYGLPSGYAFSVWGLIYTLEAIFCIWQVLPSGLANEELNNIRLPVLGVFAANSVWLFLFGYEVFWPALLVILAYDYLLFLVLFRLDANMLSRRPAWVVKLAAAAFASNASWVTVASCLQIQVNLLAEGWLPSADFAIGLLVAAVAVACAAVYHWADPVYAAVAAWALYGIVSNQSEESNFGCDTQICPACASGLPICDRVSSSSFAGRPNGFAGLHCDSYNATADLPRVCVVDKSPAVVAWAWAGIGAVVVALIIGVSRGAYLREKETRQGERLSAPLIEP
jgi:hypothetical protein